MHKGKLLQVGRSVAVVISAAHTRSLGWWRGDTIVQEVHDDHVVLRNLTPHTIRHVRTEVDYGDDIGGRTQRPV
jgi:hypothetical protein